MCLPSPLALTIFLPPISKISLIYEEDGGSIPFRTEYSNYLSLSAHCPVVDLCVNSHLLQEESSLMMAE